MYPPTCYLEGYVDDGRQKWRTTIHRLPFLIGRASHCDLILPSGRVSQRHAEIFAQTGELWLRDLDSTNGTLINGQRLVGATALAHDDVLHFADQEFRLVLLEQPGIGAPIGETQALRTDYLPANLFERTRLFQQLLERRELRTDFQPLVRLDDGSVLGYEVLGRGELGGLPATPGELFFLAESLQREVELSAAFRFQGLEDAGLLDGNPVIFVNTHPAELEDGGRLLDSLRRLRERHPVHRVVLEIHEGAIADLGDLRKLCGSLQELDIHIAFDDFGTGQARLLELTEVEPRYVKFDRAWISGLDRSSPRRHDMVEGLVRMLVEMEISTIAEGIERAEEAEVCRALGFEYAQGYHFGRPAPASSFR